MRFIFSCLLSLSVHLVLLFAPPWLFGVPAPLPLSAPIKATLRHAPVAPTALADAMTSTPTSTLTNSATNTSPQAPLPLAPKNLPDASLRQAQAMLSKHLFYPPPAVAQGLEGEVVLLLTLDTTGQIRAVDIAKSSGHVLLDEAALDAAGHIGSLPGNPRQTLLPVTFRLQ